MVITDLPGPSQVIRAGDDLCTVCIRVVGVWMYIYIHMRYLSLTFLSILHICTCINMHMYINTYSLYIDGTCLY